MKKKLLTIKTDIPKPKLSLKEKLVVRWHDSKTKYKWGTQAYTAYHFLKENGLNVPTDPLNPESWNRIGNPLKTPIFNSFIVMPFDKEVCLGILVGASLDNAYYIVRMLTPTKADDGKYIAISRNDNQCTFYNLRRKDGSNLPITPNRYMLPYLNVKKEVL